MKNLSHHIFLLFCLVVSLCACEEGGEGLSQSALEPDSSMTGLQGEMESDTVRGYGIDSLIERKPTILVLPCANGYDFSTSNVDLETLIESALRNSNQFEVIPFKNKLGVNVSGIWEKKHCDEIVKHYVADYIILNRMQASDDWVYYDNNALWGYHTRILNVRSGNMKDGIEGTQLSSFDDIEVDLQKRKMEFADLIMSVR